MVEVTRVSSAPAPRITRGLRPAFWAISAAGLLLAGAARAQHVEAGDAGSSAATAQATGSVAGQALTSIAGLLASTADADFYLINITNPASFSATTVGGTLVDTQLYLFTLAGAPVYLNDDANGASLQSSLPAGSVLGPQAAGTYILGVSVSGVDPVNSANQTLFSQAVFSTDLRGPASNTTDTVAGVFNNAQFADQGAYTITLSGAYSAVAEVPEPSVAGLLAAGVAVLGAWRQRRRSTEQA